MARPVSQEDICNLALDDLKQSPITSITTPRSAIELACARHYDQARAEALEAHPWKFATKRVDLTPDSSEIIPFGFTYAYQLPSDYIRLVSIGDDYLRDFKRDYQIEDGYLLLPSGNDADGTTLYVRYVYDVTTVGLFSPLFVRYLAKRLALNMSNKFTISTSLKQLLKEDFTAIETEAKSVNGQNRPPIRIQRSRVMTKRRGLPGGVFASKYTEFDS